MKLRAGELTERITLSEKVSARDPTFGGHIPGVVDVVTLWAKRDTKGAIERVESKAVNAVNAERFYIRYRAGVNASMLLKFNGSTYSITGVAELRRKETLMIDCEARDVSS